METLPVEIIELILAACDPKVLAISIPQVSKLFKKLSQANGTIWKAKCEQKYLCLNSKPSDQTWKRYYFFGLFKLFPLFGFTITKTTHQELLEAPGAKDSKSGTTEYVEHNSHNFWITNGKFNMMYLTYTDILPEEWVAQGLTWKISWVELKTLLKQKIGNYRVTTAPHQGQFQHKNCFAAGISAVVKEGEGADAFYYQLTFNFNYMEGTETSAKTLYALTIRGDDYTRTNNSTFRTTYEKRQCNDHA